MGISGVARIHMVVLRFLSIGLLISIFWFEKAWDEVQSKRGGNAAAVGVTGSVNKEPEKTD